MPRSTGAERLAPRRVSLPHYLWRRENRIHKKQTDRLAGLQQGLEHGEVHEFEKLFGRQREESLRRSFSDLIFKTNIINGK